MWRCGGIHKYRRRSRTRRHASERERGVATSTPLYTTSPAIIVGAPSLRSQRGPSASMSIAPAGAVRRIESTPITRICVPHASYCTPSPRARATHSGYLGGAAATRSSRRSPERFERRRPFSGWRIFTRARARKLTARERPARTLWAATRRRRTRVPRARARQLPRARRRRCSRREPRTPSRAAPRRRA